MESSIDLGVCETFCNEKQIFPAMRHFIEKLSMSVMGAAQEVNRLTDGKVTEKRAEMVWNNRKGPSSNEEQEAQSTQEPEETQPLTTEPDSALPEIPDHLLTKDKETTYDAEAEEMRQEFLLLLDDVKQEIVLLSEIKGWEKIQNKILNDVQGIVYYINDLK